MDGVLCPEVLVLCPRHQTCRPRVHSTPTTEDRELMGESGVLGGGKVSVLFLRHTRYPEEPNKTKTGETVVVYRVLDRVTLDWRGRKRNGD